MRYGYLPMTSGPHPHNRADCGNSKAGRHTGQPAAQGLAHTRWLLQPTGAPNHAIAMANHKGT